MHFHRLSAATGLAVIAMVLFPQMSAAQTIVGKIAISIESSHMSGYMGLGGGGLLPKMMKKGARKTATVTWPARPARPARSARQLRASRESILSLVADSLDRTGMNINSSLRVRPRYGNDGI